MAGGASAYHGDTGAYSYSCISSSIDSEEKSEYKGSHNSRRNSDSHGTVLHHEGPLQRPRAESYTPKHYKSLRSGLTIPEGRVPSKVPHVARHHRKQQAHEPPVKSKKDSHPRLTRKASRPRTSFACNLRPLRRDSVKSMPTTHKIRQRPINVRNHPHGDGRPRVYSMGNVPVPTSAMHAYDTSKDSNKTANGLGLFKCFGG